MSKHHTIKIQTPAKSATNYYRIDMKQKIMLALVTLGMVMIAAGIVIPIITFDLESDTFRYIYAAGALILVIGRIFTPYQGDNTRVKRLSRIEAWAAIFFCMAAFLLFYERTSLRDALAFTLAGGLIQVYTSIMIPIADRKKSKR